MRIEGRSFVTLVSLLWIAAGGLGGLHAQVTCHTEADGHCAGTCPREHPICAKVGNTGICGCQGGLVLEPYTGVKGEMEGTPPLSATFSALVVGSGGGRQWYEPGNSISFRQESPVTVLIKHSRAWGGGEEYVSVPGGILRLAVQIISADPTEPNRRWFRVTGISAVLPSFKSVALGGDETGDNVFSEIGDHGEGWIDVETGHFEVNVYAKYFNDVFCSAAALVQGRFEGTFDSVNWQATINYDSSSISLISDSPSEKPPF